MIFVALLCLYILSSRYRDYRNSDDYSYSADFWHIFAARLAFLILFEVSVSKCKSCDVR